MIARLALKGIAGALAFAGLAAAASAQSAPPPAATQPFDFYVMTLSWSPGFCATGGEDKSPEQCKVGSGEGFVVHGLWPDNQRSADPADCDPGKSASPAELAAAHGLYPTDQLAEHEYRTHGTCTGLSPADYFAAVRFARDGLTIPDMLKAPHSAQRLAPQAIEQAFIAANANLHPDNMAVTCAQGELIDVRFCLTRDLKAFSTCPKVSGHTCQRSALTVPPLR
jgi:ribonuclease T2